ncbi:nuclear transport factor 2 family protein [Paractinoplanes globisporus]|uniref:Nuclear transport factor 2 family protein n=1 Tax=Paractinoplanes globisporus TaxID=113565 RepID=A0ABW6WWB3_9ACTN|nr:nuclear transport factor 2 family protein [Actinoplanes globisporus]
MTSDAHSLLRAFDEAELHADTDTLHTLLTDDFRSIGDQGYVLDKAQWIAKFADFAYTSLESTDVEISRYDRAIIIRYVQRSRSIWRDQEMALTVRASQTWVEQPDGWKLAGIQFSTLANA